MVYLQAFRRVKMGPAHGMIVFYVENLTKGDPHMKKFKRRKIEKRNKERRIKEEFATKWDPPWARFPRWMTSGGAPPLLQSKRFSFLGDLKFQNSRGVSSLEGFEDLLENKERLQFSNFEIQKFKKGRKNSKNSNFEFQKERILSKLERILIKEGLIKRRSMDKIA